MKYDPKKNKVITVTCPQCQRKVQIPYKGMEPFKTMPQYSMDLWEGPCPCGYVMEYRQLI